VVTFDPSASTTVMKASASSPTFLGVISTEPGLLLGSLSSTTRPVTLAGRVPVKVSLENGPIAVGDRLALSPTLPGVAVKAVQNGETIGVALEPYATSTASSTLLVFINAGYYINLDSQHALASSTATTTENSLIATTWQNSSQALKSALHTLLASASGVAQSGIRELGVAVHASVGVFDTLITQTLTADTIQAQKLCLGQTCVTESQLQQLLQNSGASAAPSSSPTTSTTPTSTSSTDTSTTTPSTDTSTTPSTTDTATTTSTDSTVTTTPSSSTTDTTTTTTPTDTTASPSTSATTTP
jgi:hypothetical protein